MKKQQAMLQCRPAVTGKRVWNTALWLLLGVLLYLSVSDFYIGAVLKGNPPSLHSKRFVSFLVFLPFLSAGYLYGLWAAITSRWPRVLAARLYALRQRIPFVLRALLGLLFLSLPAYIFLFSAIGYYPLEFWARFASILLGALACAVLVLPALPGLTWFFSYSGLVLAAGSIFTAASYLNHVTSYPFALSWSEGNRLWDYSMLFPGDRLLLPPGATTHTLTSLGRQILWALPFLVPGSTIFTLRLWDALLWILPPLLLGWAAVKGAFAGISKSWLWEALFALWVFLFVSQGPIYAPLVVCALLVVLALRFRRMAVSILLVMAAGYYAQISRWTWAYAPGLWAGMLALLQIDSPRLSWKDWKRLSRPVTLGLAGYLGGQYVPKLISWISSGFAQQLKVSLVVDPSASIGYQPLLWDRLFPNATYSPGILLGTLWAGMAVVVLMVWLWRSGTWRINGLQGLAALAISAAFLGVGIVISVKIGGGSNLHNLDMFWLTLVLLAAWAVRDLARRFPDLVSLCARHGLALLLAACFLLPAAYNAQYGSPLLLPAKDLTAEALQTIQTAVSKANAEGREVLFIDQRQLLTFGKVEKVPLVVEYEKKVLMDRAMANSQKYFDGFITDLAAHRFALIITEPIHVSYITSDERTFAEENNSWVKWVSEPLLKYYQLDANYQKLGIQLLVPKP